MKKLSCIILFCLLVFGLKAQELNLPVANGKFKPTDESLQQYQYPEWFRDAKFGIWSHWGPQAVPRQGDWYAKNMYIEGHVQNKYHVANYGHPSKFGYKDIIPLWKAERWDPEKLMALYKKAGAKYFVSMGAHHDNFYLWNSKIQPWNSVNMGPKKDVVGVWQIAAKKEGLRFGVSEHLVGSYNWLQTSHGADKQGPFAGVPYDGNDPKYQDLYHAKATDNVWMTPFKPWQQRWFNSMKELIDNYHPDLIYSDSSFPFGEVGRSFLADFYNEDMIKNKGKLNAVYNCKEPSQGKWVQDHERGLVDSISPFPWQTDTSIGDWYYKVGQKYKTSDEVIQLLVDIVSKNGNLLINVVQTPEGDLEQDVVNIVNGIAKWTAANGEGIYATRPWKVFGERPPRTTPARRGSMNEASMRYTSSDIRYTVKGKSVYAFCLDTPEKEIRMVSLGKNSKYNNQTIASVSMLGSKEKLQWKQDGDALVIVKPAKIPDWKVSGYKIEFRK